MSFTFVTALYESSRVNHDGRTFEEYQKWFEKTLSIPVPMVIYTEEKNRKRIEETRKSLPTKVFYTSIDEVPFYYTKPIVEQIIEESKKNPETNIYQLLKRHPKHLEFNCMDYIPIINSKFAWMSEAIESNWFNTDMFFWIDAGLSRFMRFNISDNKFNQELINQIHVSNKLYLQVGKEYEFMSLLDEKVEVEDFIGTSVNFMMAGFWGGNRDLMLEVCNMGKQLYLDEFINKNRVDNEQMLFGYIIKRYKANLLYITYKHIDYFNYYLFTGNL